MAEPKKNDVADFDAVAFVKENSKLDDKGRRTATKADFYNFMSQGCGLPRAQVDAVSEGEKQLTDAAIRVATDDLSDAITSAKKAGDDPVDLETRTTIPTASGRIMARVQAARTNRSPQTGEKIVRHGAVTVKVTMSSAVTRDADNYAKDEISALMGE